MVLFSEVEKRIQQIASDAGDETSDVADERLSLIVQYVTTVEVLKKRLDFLGFTLDTCREMFNIAKIQEIRNCSSRSQQFGLNSYAESKRKLNDYYSKRIDLLSGTDADTWILGLREAFLTPPDADPSGLPELVKSFRPGGALPSARFPEAYDERFRLRFELEATETGDVTLDISELVDGGYCSTSDPLSSWARERVDARDREALHLIVLTEGSTDKFVLESALRVLRPEITEYLSFMDFAAFKVEGGASFLTNIVRSFAGAGIRDRIVAIFDNDTSGCLAQSILSKLDLPENIKVMRYPDIDIARDYPTRGPSGEMMMDVNGSAASIELYLGRDSLTDPSGSLIPVQWKGFEPTMKRYQGELIDKRGCMSRFSRKLDKLDRPIKSTDASAWKDLGTVIDAICSAFEVTDRDFLLSGANGINDD